MNCETMEIEMSRLAAEKARELHDRYPDISIPVDIEKMAEAEGCELLGWPFLEPVKEVKQERWIGIALGLDSRERRHLIAHALAHHLLHCGNQLSFHQQWQGMSAKQEQEAEACAAHILMPSDELAGVIKIPVWELADYFDVPEELASQRVNEYATPEEIENWNEAYDEYTA
jgi:Zn-dependent peptidase ImmA (M78 family)